jgi:hypothetical protein
VTVPANAKAVPAAWIADEYFDPAGADEIEGWLRQYIGGALPQIHQALMSLP